ncbi:hypothetical protein GS506_05275 [Rhodococcus hoagii]|nr:hypothetical protein [Prescottella equi]
MERNRRSERSRGTGAQHLAVICVCLGDKVRRGRRLVCRPGSTHTLKGPTWQRYEKPGEG